MKGSASFSAKKSRNFPAVERGGFQKQRFFAGPEADIRRIYQGRVSKVELLKRNSNGGKSLQGTAAKQQALTPQPEWEELAEWPEALWCHHTLFQEAVNYYMFALAGMAAGLPASHPLRRWRNQVHGQWHRATKKAFAWDYPYEAVANLYKLSCATCKPEDLETAFFARSDSNIRQRGDCLLALMTDAETRSLNRTEQLRAICSAKRQTGGALAEASPFAKQGYRRAPKVGHAAIFTARAGNRPFFDYWTNRALSKETSNSDAAWFEFDVDAFVEALKYPYRYLQDSKKRDAAVAKLEAMRKAILEGKGAFEANYAADEEALLQFGFKDDPRLEILQRMLSEEGDLLVEVELGADAQINGKPSYVIRQRTLRGWRRLRELWLKLVEKNEATRGKLKSAIDKEQGVHKTDFGSATLYHVLMKQDYHDLWRDCSGEPWWREWHAHDLLTAWKNYQELLDELESKNRDIRFTPAHAQYSPRFFYFPKLQSRHRTGMLVGLSRDEMNYDTHLVVKMGTKLLKRAVRLTFSAPRLQRDSLRAQDESDLSKRPWVQPMLKALGLEKQLSLQDFGNCPVGLRCLRKQGEIHSLLTFPIALDRLMLVHNIYKLRSQSHFFRVKGLKKVFPDGGWDYQFVSHGFGKARQNCYLRWRDEQTALQQEAGYWWEKLTSFSLLSIDLGRRHAGATALIRISCQFTGEQLAKARYVGTTPNGKRWHALVEATSLMKLPGEDADTYRHQTRLDVQRGEQRLERAKDRALRQELYGERGRMANEIETTQTRLLLHEFGQLELLDPDCREATQTSALRARLSFPEQNDKLIVGLRRAQAYALRLHRWTWFLRLDAKKQRRALRELAKAHREEWLKETLDKRKSVGLLAALDALLHSYREKLPGQLVGIANRVYPSHRGRLRWNRHPDKEDCFILEFAEWDKPSSPCSPALADIPKPARMPHLPGQRGLSLKRIEQFEELRGRCLSLNQMLRRVVGGVPVKSRDDTIPDPCPTLLAKLDNMKEQRCHHTAHLVLAQALGVQLREPQLPDSERTRRDIHGEYQRIKQKDGSFRSVVDFVVIEDLSDYRTSQGRAPSENSRLMNWCHRHVRDKLKELCEPFGLPVIEAPAEYSSRFCSRSGVAGFRATELSPSTLRDFKWQWQARLPTEGTVESEDRQKERFRWEEAFSSLLRVNLARVGAQATTTEWRELLDALEQAQSAMLPATRKPYRTIIVPEATGEIFVPVRELDPAYIRPAFDASQAKKKRPPIAQFRPVVIEENRLATPRLIHADINAAVNLGLRAVADPRLWSIHPRLRCWRQSTDAKLKSDRFFANEPRKFGGANATGRKEIKLWKTKESISPGHIRSSETRHPDFFADYAAIQNVPWGVATIEGRTTSDPPRLVLGNALWNAVKDQQWKRCKEINEARFRAWKEKL